MSLESVRKLLAENKRLKVQVTELQASMTEMRERSLARRVRAFHEKFGHATRHTPTTDVPQRELRFRLRFILEEFEELWEASIGPFHSGHFAVLRGSIADSNPDPYVVSMDLPSVADAIADLMYVLEGTNAALGIDGQAVMDEVHRANMDK